MNTVKVDESVLSVLNDSSINLQDSISRLNKTIGGRKKKRFNKKKKSKRTNKTKKIRKYKIIY
jgi:hypothetical protein